MAHPLQLFFDLDGTLTDSAEGISACIQHALTRLGRRQPSIDEIRPFIGTPLRAIFDAFLNEASAEGHAPASAEDAIELYRERFDAKGFAENRLYSGVLEGLQQLRSRGHMLYLATAKRPEDALRVLRHFDFEKLFVGVFGAESDAERNDKSRLLARALETTGAAPAESIMIGDRCHDMQAALRTGATPLGVGWGYGSEDELSKAGALHIASSPAEMVEWIGKRTPESHRSTPPES